MELKDQLERFESIKNLCTNYKKEGIIRKTEENLEKRLKNLETQWENFHDGHEILLEKFPDQTNISYFTNEVYEKTQQLYENTKRSIMTLLISHRQGKQNVEFDLTGMLDEGTDDKIKELMNQQECNFKALNRAMSKIKIEDVKEKWELEENLTTLKSKWESIDKSHWVLEGALKGSDLMDEYYEKFEKIEQTYDDLKLQINTKIWSNIHYQQTAPKINIPEFTGDYMSWISFKDLFLQTIHNNPSLTKPQKMQHLKTKLKGEAERLVQHLPIGGENYDSCWEILSHRYDNRRLQFTSFMNVMQNLPTIQQPSAYNVKKMHDVITESMNGLGNMDVDVSSWGPVIVYHMLQKLDSVTFSEYTKEMQNNRELPDLKEFLSFLETKFMAFETVKLRQKENQPTTVQKPTFKNTFKPASKNYNNYSYKNYEMKSFPKRSTFGEYNKELSKTFHTSTYGNCPLCGKDHVLMQCPKFTAMSVQLRDDTVTKLNVCKNCLFSHGSADCTSNKSCKECNMKHHTLLHNNNYNSRSNGTYKSNKTYSRPSTSNQQGSHHLSANNIEVLLTTVKLMIKAHDGTYVTLRALLDQGSQVNLISENAAQRLRLTRNKMNAIISGVGAVSGDCHGRLHLTCKSIHSNYEFSTEALILQKLTNNLPNRTFEKYNWPHLQNLKLADPEYNVCGPVDLLLGADVYAEIILDGVLKGNNHAPIAQQTQLGWILCGKLKIFNCHITLLNMSELTQYWESEDITQGVEDISQDDHCEKYYQDTTKRGIDGKYTVKMPMDQNFEEKLGTSKPTAISQFLQLEKRLQRNEKLSIMYKEFIREYQELGHMTPRASITSNNGVKEFYLPHHGVLRESSTTTKLRVVFNASQKTSSNKSLNSLMEKGPNLQRDIQALILKWRTYRYVFTADIEKMYRCIWLAEEQQQLQKIIWRNSPTENLAEHALQTLTYGMKSSPWLAMRTLKQLAEDDGHKYPDAAEILKNEFYVDDLISGHNNLKQAKHLQSSLIQLLAGGGMNLRKWSSNNKILLQGLTQEQLATKPTFNFKHEDSLKTLGLGWNPDLDTFVFNWNLEKDSPKKLTKRILLSQISQLYDPLGWLSPVTITAKLIFQKVWTEKIEWDERLPENIQNDWLKLRNEIPNLKTIQINRWIGSTNNNLQVFGFCDASEKAYSCVIYMQGTNEARQPVLSLLAAKTRVAPLSQKLSLPRLELCGALLLTQLLTKVKDALKGFDITIWAWSDSKVVLAWLQGQTKKWEKYVENRVHKIVQVVPAQQWNYIESKNNPADCATRGLYPNKMINFKLWWEGPTLLKTFEATKEKEPLRCLFTTNIDVEQTVPPLKNCNNNENFIINYVNKCSSLTRITRVMAWILRFIKNTRNPVTTMAKHEACKNNYLTTDDLLAANKIIIQTIQRTELKTEYEQLLKKSTLTVKSSIYKLNPYLDTDGIIRVGGRLNKTNLPLDTKNPIILTRDGRFTKLLIEQAHGRTLHGGARLTLAYIRQRYWIVGGNRAVKTQLHQCVRCHRFKRTENSQLMADLPQQRVTPSRPFTHTGVDFTGHVDVKLNKGRGARTSKGYIAIFVCMSTKAVHIELVSDLSSETFISALQRMCARRGTPKHIYSDCGTNFIGASKMLRNEYELFQKELTTTFFNELSKMEIKWHFNCPAWPTAGGLWEAAVRSMKHHLRRVLGEQKLTYEEFSTLLTKIEACMNSRPLCPLTEDPDEFYNCLSPGHFLTGSATMTLPLSDYKDEQNIDLHKRWQLTEHMLHQFWKNWSSEYLSQLQSRSKWQKTTKNLEVDDVVLVKEDNLPPGKWALGKVLKTHPGTDNRVRTVTIKTQRSVIKRPITKLALLPIGTNDTPNQETLPQQDQNQSPAPTTTTTISNKKGVKKNLLTMFISILMLFTMITGSDCRTTTGSATKSAQITSLGPERPIYYDTIGKIQLIHDEWILLTYYNLTTYWEGIQLTKTYLEDLKTICNRLDPRYCATTLSQLYHEMEQLESHNAMLLAPQTHILERRKRGLIDGVGYVANSLFGVLDQRFAEKYQQDIQAMHNNENYLLELIKNQTMIVELQNDVLKRNEDNLKKQFSSMNIFMNVTDIEIHKIESGMEKMMAVAYFSSSSLNAHLLISNLKLIQEMIYNTLVDVFKGHIDVHLLTPANLIQQLHTILSRLPKTLTLPVDNIQNEINDIYKLIYVKARVTNNFFLLEIHLPLASDDDFQLYKAFPLPLLRKEEDQTAESVIVSATYIAVNFQKGSYVGLDENEMQKCVKRNPMNFLCSANVLTYKLENKNAPCEAKLLNNHETLSCKTHIVKCEPRWVELRAINTWLAVCCGACPFRTVCDGDVTPFIIETSSIVTLQKGCLLQTKELTIHSHNTYNSETKMKFDIQVPTLNKTINNLVNTHRTPQLYVSSKENTDLEQISSLLHEQKEKELQFPSISNHDIHQYVICYSILGVAVICLVVWLLKKKGRCNPKMPYQTSARPRTQDFELRVQPKMPRSTELTAVQPPTTTPAPPKPPRTARPTSRTAPTNDDDIQFQFD